MFIVTCTDTREESGLRNKPVFKTLNFSKRESARLYIWGRAKSDVLQMASPADVDYNGETIDPSDFIKRLDHCCPATLPDSITIRSNMESGVINYAVSDVKQSTEDNDKLNLIEIFLRLHNAAVIACKVDIGDGATAVRNILVGITSKKLHCDIAYTCNTIPEFRKLYAEGYIISILDGFIPVDNTDAE